MTNTKHQHLERLLGRTTLYEFAKVCANLAYDASTVREGFLRTRGYDDNLDNLRIEIKWLDAGFNPYRAEKTDTFV